MLKQFIRDENGQPIGIMLADLYEDGLSFGWSATHPLDKFNKHKGELIAEGRMDSHTPNTPIILPAKAFDQMENFILRAQKYFKTESRTFAIDGWVWSTKKDHKPEPKEDTYEIGIE